MSGYEHGGDRYRNKVNIDFSVNINPLGVAPEIMQAMQASLSEVECYPDPNCQLLKQKLAEAEQVNEDKLVIGNGASELIMAVMHAYRPKQVLVVAPGFYGYEYAAKAVGAKISYYFCKEEDGFEVKADIVESITEETDMVILTNPGNPTGQRISRQVLEAVAKKAESTGCCFLLDECFLDFTDEETYAEHEVLRLRAFTKYYAMPGVRLGYLICSSKENAKEIAAQLPEWNCSILAQRAGASAIDAKDYYKDTKSLINEERMYLMAELERLEMKVFPSVSNYVLFKSACTNLKERLLNEGLMIRACENYVNLDEHYYRVAVRTHEENQILIEKLEKVLS